MIAFLNFNLLITLNFKEKFVEVLEVDEVDRENLVTLVDFSTVVALNNEGPEICYLRNEQKRQA